MTFWVRRFGKMIEELDAENAEGDNDKNFREVALEVA
jgi:hypothetical protein